MDEPYRTPDTRLLCADEVAERLSVPKSWVYAEARAGRLPHVVIGRYRRFRPAALDAYIEAHETGVPRFARPSSARPQRAVADLPD